MNPECNLLTQAHRCNRVTETYQVIPLSLGYVLGSTLLQLGAEQD